MRHSHIAIVVFGVVSLALAIASLNCFGDEVKVECNGKYKGGLKPTDAELKEIFKQHDAWVKDGGPHRLDDSKVADDPRRANLCDANLADAHLTGEDLEGAILEGADLEGAILDFAHLNGAYLYGADLRDAHLTDADLSGAALVVTDLNGAYLVGANLTGAHLADADLTGADLTGAEVSKAKLAYTTLTNALYAPVSEPPEPYVAGIKGLDTINAASGEEIGLIQLRKLLQDAGLRDGAREATYSIQRNITKDQLFTKKDDQLSTRFPSLAWTEGILRIVGFEWTTAYGLHPERALYWILLLGALVTPVYMVAIRRPTAESGIMRVFPAGRLEGTTVIRPTSRR